LPICAVGRRHVAEILRAELNDIASGTGEVQFVAILRGRGEIRWLAVGGPDVLVDKFGLAGPYATASENRRGNPKCLSSGHLAGERYEARRTRGQFFRAGGNVHARHSCGPELRSRRVWCPEMTSVKKLLCELIALPSVNPAFLPAGDPRAGEQRVADFLAATAARAGLEVEFQEVFPGRSNVLARLAPAGRTRQRVVLAPHLDTVGGESPELFQPREKGGRLHGRGACDTKGSVAAMLAALTGLTSSPQRPKQTEIVFAGLADEENGQGGSRALVAKGLRADLAIVGEPTRLHVVTAHKGDLWLQLETRGKAAHGSRPELGRNAVHEMARIVDLLETTYAAALRRREHPLLGHPTVSVGAIAGGSQPNIVPDRCR